MWPTAPLYTLLYDATATKGRFESHPVTTSILQRAGLTQASFRKLLPLYPIMAERLPVQAHDVVVSSSSAFAHGVRPSDAGVHVCYCHSPFRYAWFERDRALAEVPPALRPALAATLAGIRRWDLQGSDTGHALCRELTPHPATNPGAIRPGANVVHPPVEVDRFRSGEPEDYFLTVRELVPHKRIHNADRRGGCGEQEAEGRRRRAGTCDASGTVWQVESSSSGGLGTSELERLYAGARAVIVPNVEEFGIVAVESQAAGRPVLAARGGGALETIVEDVTGCFVPPGDVQALARAMRRFDADDFDPEVIQRHAQSFSPAAFRARMRAEINAAIEESRRPLTV